MPDVILRPSSVRILAKSYSNAQDRAVSRTIELIRTRYERQVNANFKCVFSQLYGQLKQFDRSPGYSQIVSAVHSTDDLSRRYLCSLYSDVADEMFPLAADSKLVKSINFGQKGGVDEYYLYRLSMQTYINNESNTHISRIDRTTVSELQRILSAADTPEDYEQSLKGYFSTSAPTRCYTIARTETSAASNAAADSAVRTVDTGREKSKRWRTYGGESVRLTHQEMDGVTIGMDEYFQVRTAQGFTDVMSFPLDSSLGASAGNIVNCRCQVRYEYV